MTPGDLVTISPPFGDNQTQHVVSAVLDAETVIVWDGHLHLAYAVDRLTVVGSGGTFPAPPVADASEWWIFPGPFKDRLGLDGLAIAASTHPVCLAAKEMLAGRKYIDLKGPQASNLLGLLIATGQPVASPYFPGSGPMTAAKAGAILGAKPTDAERYTTA